MRRVLPGVVGVTRNRPTVYIETTDTGHIRIEVSGDFDPKEALEITDEILAEVRR